MFQLLLYSPAKQSNGLKSGCFESNVTLQCNTIELHKINT